MFSLMGDFASGFGLLLSNLVQGWTSLGPAASESMGNVFGQFTGVSTRDFGGTSFSAQRVRRGRSIPRKKMDEACGSDDTDDVSYEESEGGSEDDSDGVADGGGDSEGEQDMRGYGASGEDGGSIGSRHDDDADVGACNVGEAAHVGNVGTIADFSPSNMSQLPISPGSQVHGSALEGDGQGDQDDDSQGLQEILRGRASDLAQTLSGIKRRKSYLDKR